MGDVQKHKTEAGDYDNVEDTTLGECGASACLSQKLTSVASRDT